MPEHCHVALIHLQNMKPQKTPACDSHLRAKVGSFAAEFKQTRNHPMWPNSSQYQ